MLHHNISCLYCPPFCNELSRFKKIGRITFGNYIHNTTPQLKEKELYYGSHVISNNSIQMYRSHTMLCVSVYRRRGPYFTTMDKRQKFQQQQLNKTVYSADAQHRQHRQVLSTGAAEGAQWRLSSRRCTIRRCLILFSDVVLLYIRPIYLEFTAVYIIISWARRITIGKSLPETEALSLFLYSIIVYEMGLLFSHHPNYI